jgi:hypothetical protein
MIVLVPLEEVMRALLLLIVISQAWTQEPCTDPPGCKRTIDFFLPYTDENGNCEVQQEKKDIMENTIVFNTTSVSVSLQWAGLIDVRYTSDNQLNDSNVIFECYKSYILSLVADGFSQVPESFNLDEIHYETNDILTTTSVFQVIVVTDVQSGEVYLLVLYECRENCSTISGTLTITIETGKHCRHTYCNNSPLKMISSYVPGIIGQSIMTCMEENMQYGCFLDYCIVLLLSV